MMGESDKQGKQQKEKKKKTERERERGIEEKRDKEKKMRETFFSSMIWKQIIHASK